MIDPYAELGVADDADDAAIRSRYLELVKQFPPDRDPEKFKAIRAAFDALKDRETRLKRRLFSFERPESIGGLIAVVERSTKRPRPGLKALVEMSKRS